MFANSCSVFQVIKKDKFDQYVRETDALIKQLEIDLEAIPGINCEIDRKKHDAQWTVDWMRERALGAWGEIKKWRER